MLTLKEIQNKLLEKVIGQDNAIRELSLTLYKHLLQKFSIENNLLELPGGNTTLLVGPSGSGKTFMIQEAAKLMQLPILILSAKHISQDGWHGMSLKDYMLQHFTQNTPNRNYGIVVIDEFDKMVMSNNSDSGDVSLQLQYNILTMIEGTYLYDDKLKTSLYTNQMLFIFAGAFQDLYKKDTYHIGFNKTLITSQETIRQKFKKMNMIDELNGRIRTLIEMKHLTEEDYLKLMDNPGQYHNKWCELLKKAGIIIPDLLQKEEKYAIINSQEVKDMGVRGLLQQLEVKFNKLLLEKSNELDLFIKIEEAMTKPRLI